MYRPFVADGSQKSHNKRAIRLGIIFFLESEYNFSNRGLLCIKKCTNFVFSKGNTKFSHHIWVPWFKASRKKPTVLIHFGNLDRVRWSQGWLVEGSTVIFCTRSLNRPSLPVKWESDTVQTFLPESYLNPRLFSGNKLQPLNKAVKGVKIEEAIVNPTWQSLNDIFSKHIPIKIFIFKWCTMNEPKRYQEIFLQKHIIYYENP